jgi:prepilin-type N-terminal cleavage/methylation domain-containing protein
MNKQAFSLIEIIITLAVISILIGVIAATIKIPEVYKTLRDFQRVQNLSNLNKAFRISFNFCRTVWH